MRSNKHSPPSLVRLSTFGRSVGIAEGAVCDRLTHCRSSDKHDTHTVVFGIVFPGLLLEIRCVLRNRVTSYRMWLFTIREAILVAGMECCIQSPLIIFR